MDTMQAFAMGQASRGNEMKVFDWNKAAAMIRDKKPQRASAGLYGDWEWTGGGIYENGRPIKKEDTYTYLCSTWATPELDIDGETFDCYLMESEVPKEWGKDYSDIYWPDSALKILNDEVIQ